MRIHPAQIAEADGAITVRYAFEAPSSSPRVGELWFRVPARWSSWIHAGPEPAVAALAFLALALGEDIEVAQPLSARFHYGFHQAAEHFRLWWPQLRPVALRAPGLVSPPPSDAAAVASCFSGGVDSFHTLYAHLDGAAPNPAYRLTHLFFAHGFDIPLANPSYDAIAAEFEDLARALGLELIRVATNAREMLDAHLRWDQTHGACIAAGALLLSGGLRRLLVPSTNRQSLLFLPCGSNPVTDPMLGTESLDIVHYGTHASRIEKILALADRREAQAHLRVCWQNVAGARNCGRCVKCVKTMMPLAIVGALDQFSVFPPQPPWRAADRRCFTAVDLSDSRSEVSYTDELRALAKARRFSGWPLRVTLSMFAAQAAPLARALRRVLRRRALAPRPTSGAAAAEGKGAGEDL